MRVLPNPDNQVEASHIMRALEPAVVDVLFATIEPCSHRPIRPTRWAVTGPGSRTDCASGD